VVAEEPRYAGAHPSGFLMPRGAECLGNVVLLFYNTQAVFSRFACMVQAKYDIHEAGNVLV